MSKVYTVRRFQNGKGTSVNASLTIPSDLARHIPSEQKFTCEALDGLVIPDTDEFPRSLRGRTLSGIFYNVVDSTEDGSGEELPSWAKKDEEKPKAARRARPRATTRP
jgi:hypothetical protein